MYYNYTPLENTWGGGSRIKIKKIIIFCLFSIPTSFLKGLVSPTHIKTWTTHSRPVVHSEKNTGLQWLPKSAGSGEAASLHWNTVCLCGIWRHHDQAKHQAHMTSTGIHTAYVSILHGGNRTSEGKQTAVHGTKTFKKSPNPARGSKTTGLLSSETYFERERWKFWEIIEAEKKNDRRGQTHKGSKNQQTLRRNTKKEEKGWARYEQWEGWAQTGLEK